LKPRTIQSLLDVHDFNQELITLVESVPLDAYLATRSIKLQTERLLEMIGEAMHRAIRADPIVQHEIPESMGVIGMRNRIVHGYDEILDEVVWDVATRKVPVLDQRITVLLTSLGELPGAELENGQQPR
jgi:uncharacterized protein with HEPN domain